MCECPRSLSVCGTVGVDDLFRYWVKMSWRPLRVPGEQQPLQGLSQGPDGLKFCSVVSRVMPSALLDNEVEAKQNLFPAGPRACSKERGAMGRTAQKRQTRKAHPDARVRSMERRSHTAGAFAQARKMLLT